MKIYISNHIIKNVKSEKHLGHYFQNSGNIIDFNNVIGDIKIRSNVIANQFRPVSWQGKATLFMSQCASFHGCHLWSLEDNKIKELYTAWHVGCRKVLGLDSRTRTYMLSHLLKTMPIEDLISYRMCCFFLNGMNNSNSIIKSFFSNSLVSSSSCIMRNLNIILDKIHLRFSDFLSMNKNELKRQFVNLHLDADWRVNMIRELLDIRDNQLECGLDISETGVILKYISNLR